MSIEVSFKAEDVKHQNTQAKPHPRVGQRILNALNGTTFFNLVDDGLADLLCLKTYTHGTSPRTYSRILAGGADPALGAKGGENAFYEAMGMEREKEGPGEDGWDCKGKFFVFNHKCRLTGPASRMGSLVKRYQPKVYSVVASIGEDYNKNASKHKNRLKRIGAVFKGLFCSPVLKFRFTPEEGDKLFKADKTFSGGKVASYSEDPIYPNHIGMIGTFKQGVKGSLAQRIKKNPRQFIKGLVKLISALAIAALVVVGSIFVPPIGIAAAAFVGFELMKVALRIFVPLGSKSKQLESDFGSPSDS